MPWQPKKPQFTLVNNGALSLSHIMKRIRHSHKREIQSLGVDISIERTASTEPALEIKSVFVTEMLEANRKQILSCVFEGI